VRRAATIVIATRRAGKRARRVRAGWLSASAVLASVGAMRWRRKLAWAVRNHRNGLRIARELRIGRRPLADVTRYERRFFSQNGEDGILQALFAVLGTTNRYFVEFGAGKGSECNTASLARRHGWRGLLMDAQAGAADAPVPVQQEYVTAENIGALLDKYGVPASFDLLSIDIDGNDYWVWRAITRQRARVVVIEYNASRPPTESRVIAYDPDFRWSGTDYFGASLPALAQLGRTKRYTLVGCDSSGTNAFFVDDALAGRFVPQSVQALYRPPAYRRGRGHPPDPTRIMAVV
jgi:hypothetical protein